jgi:hypothetical protein
MLIDALPSDPHRSGLILRSAMDTVVTLITLIDQVCAGPPALTPARRETG